MTCTTDVDHDGGQPSTGFVGLLAPRPPDSGAQWVRADLRLYSGRGSVWVALTGTGGALSLVQLGMLERADGPRLFLAHGWGEPGTGHYTECDMGPADRLLHTFRVGRSGGFFRLLIDGVTVLTLVDDLPWPTNRAQVMSESHAPAMPGIKARDMVVDGALPDSWSQTWGIGNDADVDWYPGLDINRPDGFRVWA